MHRKGTGRRQRFEFMAHRSSISCFEVSRLRDSPGTLGTTEFVTQLRKGAGHTSINPARLCHARGRQAPPALRAIHPKRVPSPGSLWYRRRMGHVYVDAEVFARRRVKVRFLVDTGATYTILPATIARAAGSIPLPTRFAVSLADGSRRSLLACTMGIEIERRTAPMTALLLPDGEPLLGVETLEALGLRVNPVSRCLEPTRAQTALLVGLRPRPVHRARTSVTRRPP